MIKHLSNFLFLTLLLSSLHAQYNASSIPKELLEDANVVVRKKVTEILIHNISSSVETGTYAVTILNEKGKSHATFPVYYSESFAKSVSMTGELYDARGKRIKKLKRSEINDISAVSGGTLYSDSRVLVANMEHNQYPYTVVYSYRKPLKDQILVPGWSPQSSSNQSVEEASLSISVPNDLELKYKNIHLKQEPTINKSSKETAYSWNVNSLKAVEREILAPSIYKMLPMVLLAMSDFKWKNFEGSARSWKDYGKFFYDLNEGRDELPPELEEKVVNMCANVEDPKEKIRILYEYMQENTRYVSVQLGIGGWQTYDAEYVYNNGYGDCKALSNYMKSMLKKIGITSYVSSIYAGDEKLEFQTDFPSSQSNHVILCVPMAKDTMWLECTSSENPVGYLGDFTEDRYTLLFTPEGGKLLRTPSSPPEANQQIRKAMVKLSADGSAKVNVHMTYTGYQQSAISNIALNQGTKDQEKWLRNQIDAGSFQLQQFEFEENKTAHIPTWYNTYQLQATQWAGVSGSRIFLTPNVLEKQQFIPPALPNRTQPLELSNPYTDTDSVIYTLPINYRIESMPDMPIKIEEKFGIYEVNIVQKDPRTIIYTRKIKMQKMQLPPESYKNFRNFIRGVVKADKLQIVLSDKS